MKRLILLVLLVALAASVGAQTIKESGLVTWNGYSWERVVKGALSGSKYLYESDFDAYSNSTTGVALLALGSAPDNTNILTPYDWHWGTTLVTGTVKAIAATGGTMVLDTAHGAQNDAATMTWREAVFSMAKNPSLTMVVKLNNKTNCIFEAGWYVDANDEILFRFNSAVSATYWNIVYEKNNGGEVVYTTTSSPTAGAYATLRIDILSTGGARCYINGVLVKTYAASTIRDVAFKPRFYAKVTDAGHAATKTLTLDYVRIVQDR